MDIIKNLRAFHAVARHNSFSMAASEMNLAPSVITKRISQLENLIGATLIYRNSRHVSLTESGTRNLVIVDEILQNFDHSWRHITENTKSISGKMKVAVPTSLGFMSVGRLIWKFSQDHPDLSIEVILRDGPRDPRLEKVDVSLTAHPDSFDGASDEVLWRIDRSLYASRIYINKNSPLESPHDLYNHQCLVFSPSGPVWEFMKNRQKKSITVTAAYASNNMADLLYATRQGGGIAILNNYIIPSNDKNLQEQVLKDYEVPPLWIKALIRKDVVTAPRVRQLLDFLRSTGLPPLHE
ncbi:LysR family transcriptional regulator [Paracoccus marcusii]|uniref:LysR family transcriptional regulator n=1 Tax=Paracoccus marcusii TaxID=59779 RepID=UPI0032644C5D